MLTRSTGILLLLLAGCTRSSSTSGPSDLPPVISTSPSSVPTTASRGTWTLTADTHIHRYTSTIRTNLELHSQTGPTRDSISQVFTFNLAITPLPPSITLSGTVEAFSAQSGSRITGPADPVLTPFHFTGQVTNGAAILKPEPLASTASPSNCTNPALAILSAIQRTVILTPQELTSGMTWTDSSSMDLCSGTIPVTATTTRVYRVIGEVNHPKGRLLLVERTEKTITAGEGSQQQHRVILTSEGTGSARLYLDPKTGRLVETEGSYRTTLTVNTSGRTQTFTQAIREHVLATR